MGLKSWLSNLGTSDYDRYEAEDERALNEEIMRAAKAEEERQHKQREAERQALLDALRYE